MRIRTTPRELLRDLLLSFPQEATNTDETEHNAQREDDSLSAVLKGRACVWRPRSKHSKVQTTSRTQRDVNSWISLISSGVDEISAARMRRRLREAASQGRQIVMLEDLIGCVARSSSDCLVPISQWFEDQMTL